jgi:arginyl-tRNA--protein-N-Asp/Glu arginylyltransferase
VSAEPIENVCAYPALPAPVKIPLANLPAHACPYLPNRIAEDRAIWASEIPAELYERFMDAGFRRSGRLIYQPACRGCRECKSIRVPVAKFRPDKSQRRCAKRNADLHVLHGPPKLTSEKCALYEKYLALRHLNTEVVGADALESFLYDSPLKETLEFEYRDVSGKLLAAAICDLCPTALSSVYCFYDPEHGRRGLGTYAALHEIQFAAERGVPHYYMGYWVKECAAMNYKANFGPSQVLGSDGVWRELQSANCGIARCISSNRKA